MGDIFAEARKKAKLIDEENRKKNLEALAQKNKTQATTAKKIPEPIPQSTQKKPGGGRNKTGGGTASVSRSRDRKAQLPESGKKAFEEAQATYAIPRFMRGASAAMINTSVPALASSLLTGEPVVKPSEAEKKLGATDSFAYKAGEFVGQGIGYMMPYGAAEKQIAKGAAKVLGTNTAKKAVGKAAASRLGQRIGREAVEETAEGLAKSIIGDATIGTAMNYGVARSQGLEGEELAKDMLINAGADLAFGAGAELLPVAFKGLKSLKKTPEIIPDAKAAGETVSGLKKAAGTPEVIPGNTRKTIGEPDAEVDDILEPAAATAGQNVRGMKLNANTQQAVVEAVERRSGVKVSYEDLPEGIDGTYENGVITISQSAKNPAYTVLKHELTHHIESSGNYQALSDFIEKNMRDAGYDVDGALQTIIKDYAQIGKNLTPEQAKKEFVAKFSEEYLFNSEKSIERLARDNPNLFRRIYDWIVDTVKKIGASDETKFLIDAQRKYEKALRTVGQSTGGEAQYLYAGRKSWKADEDARQAAESMLAAGADPEYVWRETGWKLGKDQQWRFEFSDKDMEVFPNGDALFRQNHPEYVRLQDLYQKFWNGNITEAEVKELEALDDTWGNEYGRLNRRLNNDEAYLEDVIKHDVLFEHYPYLRRMPYRLRDFDFSLNGRFNPNDTAIEINRKLQDDGYKRRELEETVVHEVQHAIQMMEDFEPGGNLESGIVEARRIAEEVIDNHQADRYAKEYLELSDARLRDSQNGTNEAEHYIDNFLKKQYNVNTIEELKQKTYESLYGEREASSTAERLKYDESKRRTTLPDYERGALTYKTYPNMGMGRSEVGKNIPETTPAQNRFQNIPGRAESNSKLEAQSNGRTSSLDGDERTVRTNNVSKAQRQVNFPNYEEGALRKNNKSNSEVYKSDSMADKRPYRQSETLVDWKDNRVEAGDEPAFSIGDTLGGTEYTNRLSRASRSLYGEKKNKYLETIPDRTATTQKNASADVPVKGQKSADTYQKRAERDFAQTVADSLGISKYSDNRRIREMVGEAAEKVKKGTFTEADKEKLFDEMFAEGIIVDESFVKQYASLKQTIRNTPLHLTDDVRANIADFDRFRKGNLNTVRMSNDSGAEIDIFYDELRTAYPELFPQLNTPAEMLEKISEVAKSIKKTETRLADMAGDDWELLYEESRAAFNREFSQLENQSNRVKKFLASKSPVSVEGAKQLIENIKTMRREVDKLKSKMLLSDYELEMVEQLHKGRWNEAMVRTADPLGADAILSVYEAEKPLRAAEKALKATGKETKKSYRDKAAEVLLGSELWHDKQGWRYGRETAERNAVDIAGKEAGKKLADTFFRPVHEHEAVATRMKNELRTVVRNLKISTKNAYDITNEIFDAPGLTEEIRKAKSKGKKIKASESTLVQLYGEKLIDDEMLMRIGADVDKIAGAVSEMRTIYNQLFDAANAELVRHGYEPIEFRQDYFPHFTEDKPDGLLAKAANALGFNILKDELPADIAGLTHTFKPGKTWFGNMLQRTSEVTEYDAIKGFDIYLEGISDIIHHTEDIQMLRALETETRYKHGPAGLRRQIDEIRNRTDLSESQKDAHIETLLDKGNSQLGSFATWLRGYTDNLAGKKSQIDRTFEHNLGRGLYNTSKAIESRVAANMVAVNPGSWLTNFIPLVQGSEVKNINIIKGMAETIGNHIRHDRIGEMSTFLTNRKGSDVLWKSGVEKVQDIMTKPMQWIDDFVSESLVRAKYLEEVGKGVNSADAMKAADDFAANVIADRSKGALPTFFNAKNPISKIFTMYQVEVNNQWSHLFKDIPRTEENVAKVALSFAKFAVGAYIFNDVYESIAGRRPALDPLSWANEFMGDVAGKQVKNFVEALLDDEEGILEETEKKDLPAAAGGVAGEVLENIPFVGGVLGGGRVPIQSALPDLTVAAPAGLNVLTGNADKKDWYDLETELAKPAAYILPPVGGGQAKKLVETAINYQRGGNMAINSDGERELRFATDREFWPVLRDATFGQYSGKNAINYVDSGFKRLSANETAAFEGLVDSGVKPTDAENFLRGLLKYQKDIEKAILESDYSAAQKNAIGRALYPNPDDKVIDYSNKSTYKYSKLPEKSQAKVDKLVNAGLSKKDALNVYEVEKTQDKNIAKALALMQEEEYKAAVFSALGISEEAVGKAKALQTANISADDYVVAWEMANTDKNTSVNSDEAYAYLETTHYSRAEKYALFKALTRVKDKNNPYR